MRIASSLRRAARPLAAVLLVGLAAGVAMSYVAARHNPQGEFSGPDGRIRIALLLPVFAGWFVVGGGLAFATWRGWSAARARFR